MEGDVEAVGWVGRAELMGAVVSSFDCVIFGFWCLWRACCNAYSRS